MEKIVKTPVPQAGMGWSAIGEEEIAAVTKVLKNPSNLFRYNEGSMSYEVEAAIKKLTGIDYALFVASGTAALACCLSGFEIGPGHEVIVPGYTYIATAAAVIDVGAVPVICEIDESLGMCPVDLEKKITPHTKAVIPVHMQGIPVRLDEITAICKKHNLLIIEDCCQAIGATYKGKHVGTQSDAAAWSTNFFKTITCGEGGVYLTNNADAFQRGVYQSDSGMTMWKTTLPLTREIQPFSRSGVRGNEVAAAVLSAQLEKLSPMLTHTRALKKRLISKLNPPKNYKLQHVDDPEGDSGFSFTMIANDRQTAEKLNAMMVEAGLAIGSVYNEGFPDRHVYAHWDPIINKLSATPAGYPWADPAYKGNVEYSADMCPNTLDILQRCLRITLNIKMTETNIDEFAAAINAVDAAL
ncbi:MAG: aminotransferase class I/II-fold pyridoxal phosphate-dependent enzyme [Defluviitaleaceae bacterium]|nr:aminotransferase class I/II-fold pyridoxal phosphate-dependent enzyme [Defluviitaleaceae bacterium]